MLQTLMKIMNNVSNHTPASVYFWPLFEHFKTLLTTLTNSALVAAVRGSPERPAQGYSYRDPNCLDSPL